MTKETVVNYKCTRCPHEESAKINMHLGIAFKPGYPQGWKTINEKMICKKCVSEYNSRYASFWKQFLEDGKK